MPHFHTVKVCSTFLISDSNLASSMKGSLAIPCKVQILVKYGRCMVYISILTKINVPAKKISFHSYLLQNLQHTYKGSTGLELA